MTTLTDILKARGHQAFADALDTSMQNISQMKKKGKVPPHFRLRTEKFCKDAGLSAPSDEVFSYLPVEAEK